ncbi:threonine/serine exporter family protein [uncultured Lutibacter sp.]|uniref:threonine/serine ThrE exporter family protein n=1 Tax=uncultured Lutibacter sp. TaxID=437739 RepID=UPI00261FA72E|nr:threonine/serine exporter family protein [uncultured Lutibacter sp.]
MKASKKYQFIIQLGKALHTYGVPSYKIQTYLTNVSKIQGIKGSFMDLPTWINYVFYEENGKQTYNHIECVPPGNLNLGALSRVSDLTRKVTSKEIKISEVAPELDLIQKETKKVNHFILTLSYALASGAFSLMIGTNWISLMFALVFGALVYFFVFLASKSSYISTVLESLASFVVTILAGLLVLVIPEFNVGLTVLSSIIIFVPGLALTTALEEITSKSLVSGSAKLFDALISLFKQFFGVVLGVSLLSVLINIQLINHISSIPKWVMLIAVPLFSISLLPIFQVRKKDMLLGVITGISGFSLTVLFSSFGILISTFVGTIIVVILSNLFSRFSNSPKTVFLTQGIIMLVPGSKSFMGLSNVFLKSTIVNATNIYEQVAYILMGIIGGLLFAGVFRSTNSINE